MKYLLLLTVLSAGSVPVVRAMPVVDQSRITDFDKFYIDNGQCLAYSESGASGDGGFEKGVVAGAGLGAASGAAFGAMAGGDIGSGAGFGALAGGLGSAGNVYGTSPGLNDNSYKSCMERRGYTFK